MILNGHFTLILFSRRYVYFCVNFENIRIKLIKKNQNTVNGKNVAMDSIFGNIRLTLIFAGDLWKACVKRQWTTLGGRKRRFLSAFGSYVFGSFRNKTNVRYYIVLFILFGFPLNPNRWPWMILSGHFTFVAMIILHILSTNGVVFIVTNLAVFLLSGERGSSGRRLRPTSTMSGIIKQLNKILTAYD